MSKVLHKYLVWSCELFLQHQIQSLSITLLYIMHPPNILQTVYFDVLLGYSTYFKTNITFFTQMIFSHKLISLIC